MDDRPVGGGAREAQGGGFRTRRGVDPEDLLDPEAIPAVPTPETDARLRIPEVLRQKPGAGPTAGASGRGSSRDSGLMGMAAAWAVALDFVFMVLAGCTAGYFMGQWKGNQAGWVLLGMALGLTVGIWRLIKRAQAEDAADQKRKAGRAG